MATGLRAFNKLQISSVEATVGTATAAKEILLGVMSAPGGDKVIYDPEHDRGTLSKFLANPTIVGRYIEGSVELDANTRHMAWLFCNAIRGGITPTQPAATLQPNAYLWTVEPGLTIANTPDITNGIDTFTLEWGDNLQAYEAEFVFTRTLEISGGPNELCKVKWDWGGRQATQSNITTGLTASAVQYFPFNLAKMYIDVSVAAWGTTPKTDTLQAFTWTLETQFTPRYTADGSLFFTALNEASKNVDLELTFTRNAVSEAERVKYDALTKTWIRLELLGSTVLDAGQSNPPYILLDGCYQYTEWPELSDEDGTNIETVKLHSVYDSTGSKEYSVKLYTDLAAYP